MTVKAILSRKGNAVITIRCSSRTLTASLSGTVGLICQLLIARRLWTARPVKPSRCIHARLSIRAPFLGVDD